MATFLYRVGRFAYRRKFVVIGIWLVVLIGFGAAAAAFSQPTKDSFSIPGTPAQQAQDLMAERFPNASDPFSAVGERLVYQAPEGQTLADPQNVEAVNASLDKLRAIPELAAAEKAAPGPDNPGALLDPVSADAGMRQALVAQAEAQGTPADVADENVNYLSPLSQDKTVGYVDTSYDVDFKDITQTMRDSINDAAQVARDAGLNVQMSGVAAQELQAPGGSSELLGMGVALVVLMITFGALVAAGLPLITAIVGISIGSLGIQIASGFTDLNSMTPTLAVMIGLAVAIDYSLFIVSRFRSEIRLTDDRAEAAGLSVGTAGSAVVFAGLTVIIALLALRVVGIPFLSDMGAAAAFTVFMAVLIALTLLPALLGLFGRFAFAGRIPGLSRKEFDPNASTEARHGIAAAYIRRLTKAPIFPFLTGVIVLAILAVPMFGMRLALPTDATASPDSSNRKAYDLIDDAFGPGKNGPLLAVVDAKNASVPATEAFGQVALTISQETDVLNAQVVELNPAGDTAQILITPKSGPTGESTIDLVHSIRDHESHLAESIGVDYGVTGQTALELDVSDKLSKALVPYLAVVVGLAFILLMLVFRSILVPLTATLGFLLSVVATFGVTVAIFQDGWGGIVNNPQPIVSFMPIFLIGVVFGLAMDYQVFLVTRMREEYVHGADAKHAITLGFQHGARVVTAAAIIMTSVFGAFIFEKETLIKSMGFALAAAVVFDAFFVRMLIIPSVMAWLGDRAWWLPKWLDKILPNVDVEGSKLGRSDAAKAAAAAPVE